MDVCTEHTIHQVLQESVVRGAPSLQVPGRPPPQSRGDGRRRDQCAARVNIPGVMGTSK